MPKNDHFSEAPAPVDARPEDAGYESADAQPRTVVLIAGIIAAGVAFSLLAAAWFYHLQFHEPAGEFRQTSFQHGPFQRSSIAADWTALDRQSDMHLDTYGWVDQPKGIVRVPITRAMDLLVAEVPKSSAKAENQKARP